MPLLKLVWFPERGTLEKEKELPGVGKPHQLPYPANPRLASSAHRKHIRPRCVGTLADEACPPQVSTYYPTQNHCQDV